ncbi:phosphonate metabolism protein/1,5-bisphosphokinase (PRPP-forming) PhnN [Shimia thalassica]|uniref:phosphonate metabolism protein/1,5-bisphosphokinase (PRPP-forming) PhnN n=1 Tax=Shimia thalassica TaxID=1715693 RepID=UPI0026E1C5D6|nr:phosphonate metabolism protein/1,5-bisphosphokinase (PRPP-forming) PhnN [Shimia thalassica]MDO6484139.1 phosphonate metabolism protein/1,5-bisphosphokinase (PRPP-forming) PhnN [Shimia thalassica]
MAARLIAVVGPSGVGKDTVMHALAASDPSMSLVRRVITRPSDAGGEDFGGVTRDEFDLRVARGDFCLWWDAHGLSYGIPKSQIEHRPEGTVALVNLSRSILDEARASFDGFRVISLTANPETLARRLGGRGRETQDEILRRLARAGHARPQGEDVIEICNDGALDDTIRAITVALYPERAVR